MWGSRQFSLPEEFHRNSWCERPTGSISKGCQHQAWIGWGAAEGGYPGRAPARLCPTSGTSWGPRLEPTWAPVWMVGPPCTSGVGGHKRSPRLFPCQANAHMCVLQCALQAGAGHGMLCTLWPPCAAPTQHQTPHCRHVAVELEAGDFWGQTPKKWGQERGTSRRRWVKQMEFRGTVPAPAPASTNGREKPFLP